MKEIFKYEFKATLIEIITLIKILLLRKNAEKERQAPINP